MVDGLVSEMDAYSLCLPASLRPSPAPTSDSMFHTCIVGDARSLRSSVSALRFRRLLCRAVGPGRKHRSPSEESRVVSVGVESGAGADRSLVAGPALGSPSRWRCVGVLLGFRVPLIELLRPLVRRSRAAPSAQVQRSFGRRPGRLGWGPQGPRAAGAASSKHLQLPGEAAFQTLSFLGASTA